MDEDAKVCPRCAETVRAQAQACRFCGYDFTTGTAGANVAAPSMAKPAPVFLIISLIALVASLVSPRFLVFLPLLITAALAVLSLVRREKWRWLAILILAACLALLLWAGGSSSRSYAGKDVTYKVTGSASEASLTYENGEGGTSQEKVALPWTQTVQASSSHFLYISAQNQGEYGDITCSIIIDGEVVKTSTSSGAYTIASCSA